MIDGAARQHSPSPVTAASSRPQIVQGRWATQMWLVGSTLMPPSSPNVHWLGSGNLGQVGSMTNFGTSPAALLGAVVVALPWLAVVVAWAPALALALPVTPRADIAVSTTSSAAPEYTVCRTFMVSLLCCAEAATQRAAAVAPGSLVDGKRLRIPDPFSSQTACDIL
jgi:hypothetical protein